MLLHLPILGKSCRHFPLHPICLSPRFCRNLKSRVIAGPQWEGSTSNDWCWNSGLLLQGGFTSGLRCKICLQAFTVAEAIQINKTRSFHPRPGMCSRCMASGTHFLFLSKVACQSLGPLEKGGMVVGIDVKKVKVPNLYCDSRVRTICADVMTLLRDQARALSPQARGFSVILSDMCPPVSGITTKDAALSCELGEKALSLAVGEAIFSAPDESPADAANSGGNGILQHGGNLVIKLLESRDTQEFGQFCKARFKKSSWIRPKATRSSSREIYLVCQGLQ